MSDCFAKFFSKFLHLATTDSQLGLLESVSSRRNSISYTSGSVGYLIESTYVMCDSVVSKRAEKKIAKAKAKARPELQVTPDFDEWKALRLHENFDLTLEPIAQRDTLQRVSVKSTSHEEFVDFYEKPLRPVVLTDVTNSWPAQQKWTIDYLLKKYRNERFKCGEDDYGYNVKLKFKYFAYYMRNNCDDSPLYIFDGNFGEHRRKKSFLAEYSLPEYFREDLFRYVGEQRRPPFRWIVIGSARSGTGIHIDPLGTSAWNALLVGYKRWCLFPTTTPRDLIKLSPISGGKQNSEAVQWFNMIYPQTQTSSWPEQYKPIEVLQRPGETMFVPSGWWHVVMNLTNTVAITQNFVSTANFHIVWHKTVRSRPKLSKRWLSELSVHRPDLVELTKKIDINSSIGVTSDSSSGSSSSSSSTCSCSSCIRSESDDSGQVSSVGKKKRRIDTTDRDDSMSSNDDP